MTTEFQNYFDEFISAIGKHVSSVDPLIVEAADLLGGIEVGILHEVMARIHYSNMPYVKALIVGSLSDDKLLEEGVLQEEIDELNVLYRSKQAGLDAIRARLAGG